MNYHGNAVTMATSKTLTYPSPQAARWVMTVAASCPLNVSSTQKFGAPLKENQTSMRLLFLF